MAPSANSGKFDESVVDFFEEQFCTRADMVYRFSYGLLLSPDGARNCTFKAFEELAARLEEVKRQGAGLNPTQELVRDTWRAYNEMKQKDFKSSGAGLAGVLAPLPVEARAALMAVDMAGLSAAEAAQAFEWDEPALRRRLAEARRSLVENSGQF